MLTFNNLIQENKYIDPKDVDRGWGGFAGRIVGGGLGAGLGGLVAGAPGAVIAGGLGTGVGSYVGGSLAGNASDRKKLEKDKTFQRMGYLLAPQADGVGSTLASVSFIPGIGPIIGVGSNLRSLSNAEKLGYKNDALGTMGQGFFGSLRGLVTPQSK